MYNFEQATFEALNYAMYLLPRSEIAMELCSVITEHNIFADSVDKYRHSVESLFEMQSLARSFMRMAIEFYNNLSPPLIDVFGELLTPKFMNYLDYAPEWMEIGDVRLTDTESFEMAGKDWHTGWQFNNKQLESAVVQCFLYETRL